MSNSFASNLKKLRAEHGLSQLECAESLGIKRTTLANYENGVSEPDIDKIKEIANFFGKTLDELMGGKLKPSAKSTFSSVSEPAMPGIPYFNTESSASDVEIFNDIPEQIAAKISIPGFEDCEAALPIFGHSMYPTYENGCIVLCKRIRDLDVISYGEVYLLVTAEQRLLKRVQKSQMKDNVLLVSDNDELRNNGTRRYEPFDLPKKKIKHLFIVKGSIKRNQM